MATLRFAGSVYMSDSALLRLLSLLDLEAIEENLFRGLSPPEPVQRVFGGQVLAQALVAAARTVDAARLCHSFHAYFLRPGDPKVPILYQVDRSRDGASFTARRVVAIQHGAQIFTLAASFQRSEAGFEHQAQMPLVPDPESLEDDQQVLLRQTDLAPAARAWIARERAFETRSVLGRGPSGPSGDRPARAAVDHIWLRTRGRRARRSGAAAGAAGFRVRHVAAGHRAPAPRQEHFLRGEGRQPRPCDVVSPALPRRRLAALCPGQSFGVGRAGL